MNSLKIPDGGVLLAASDSKHDFPPQAFHVRLDNSLIESIIQSHQTGEDIRLALGKTPTLHYGSKAHRISPPTDTADYDLYLTKPYESTREAVRIAYTTSLFQNLKQTTKARSSVTEIDAENKTRSSSSNKGSTSSGLDSDRERARVIGKVLDSKKATGQSRAKPISEYGSKAGSLPASPGINAAHSPSLNPTTSASQQAMERAKEQRITLVHELAVQDYPLDYLKDRWSGKESEFRPTLEKVAEYSSGTEKWTLRKTYLKELDVWNYDYGTQEERQKAIDNAIKQYDKQRLSSYEPEWQKLLPKEERNKGKCLSRLQANLAKGPAQTGPIIKVLKAEDGSMSGDNVESDKPKAGGEQMLRSSSNPLPSKPKKTSGQDAKTKRLLGASKVKPAAPKTSPKKTKAAATKANGRPALSEEIILNSDTSGDEISAPTKPLSKPKPKSTTTTTTTTTATATTTKAKDTTVDARRPSVKVAPVKPALTKRPLEDEDSSSSSGTPLSKRIKQKHPLPAPKANHRPSDASINSSRGTAGSSSIKGKNTSPTKSSPLASSPPTNASEIEIEAARLALKKRKTESEAKPAAVTAAKKRTTDVSTEVLNKANKFKAYYQQYEALHYEILALDNPSDEKLANLLDMRGRLETMKKEIYRECSPA